MSWTYSVLVTHEAAVRTYCGLISVPPHFFIELSFMIRITATINGYFPLDITSVPPTILPPLKPLEELLELEDTVPHPAVNLQFF